MIETSLNPLDEPTEQSAKQELSRLPTWEEWLPQHGFIKGEKHRSAISAVEWNRDWPAQGRGWRVRVAPSLETVNIIVLNNTSSRMTRHTAMVSVAERSVVNIVQKLITEIERPVSDITKKRRIKAFTSTIPYAEREDEVGAINGPVLTPGGYKQLDALYRLRLTPPQQEAGPLRAPIPDDPGDLSKEQLDKMFQRVRVRCFQPGQRVRVRSPRETGLNGELGTVVDASEHACYVSIDSYTNAGDPDPFRFEEHELEPIFGESEEADEPENYLAALDYMQMLPKLGYRVHNEKWQRSPSYVKVIGLGKGSLRLMIEALPNEISPLAVVVYIEYIGRPDEKGGASVERIQEFVTDAFGVMDAAREVEQLAAQSGGVADFAEKLDKCHYPQGTRVPSRRRLRQIFGEAMMEAENPDDPEPYFADLQRHADVINAFREHGLRLRRRMTAERPHYEMFWIPTAVSDVGYDVFLQPEGEGWTIWARGEKRFEHSRWGEITEPFEIEDQWQITSTNPDEIAVDVDNILHALNAYQGPDELTVDEQDFDDLDEALREHILYPAVWLDGHVYIGPSHVAIMRYLESQHGLALQPGSESHKEPHHGWWTDGKRFLDSDLDVNEIIRLDRRYASRSGEEPGLKGETLPLAKKIGEVRMVESADDPEGIEDYAQYAATSAEHNIVKLVTSKDLRNIIRPLGFRIDTLYRSRITHGWTLSATPATAESFRVFQENPYKMAEFLQHELRQGLIKRFPELGQITKGQYVFDQKLELRCWEWSGATSAHPENPNNWTLYADLLPIDHEQRREARKGRGRKVAEAEEPNPDEIKDLADYAKGTVDAVKILEEFGYVYSESAMVSGSVGTKRWNKYWDLPRPLQTKRPYWTPTFTKVWGSPDTHGQYVYGLIDPEHYNAKSTGYIIVQPLNRVTGKDDWDITTSIRRMLLQVENLFRSFPDTDDPDVTRNWLFVEMEKIKDAVNKEANATWNESLEVPDPDDPEAFVKRSRLAKMGELVTTKCPRCGHEKQLFKNWPDNMPDWGSKCDLCGHFVQLPTIVSDSVDDPPEKIVDKPKVYSLYCQYANYDSSVGIGSFLTLNAAVDKAKEMGLHDEYQHVWIDEDETDSLEPWGKEAFVVRYAGIKYLVKPDYTVERVEDADRHYGGVRYSTYPRYPKLGESDEDIDPATYAEQTFDPEKFLESSGWKRRETANWPSFGKDFPLPHVYYLGGMEFDHLMVTIAFDHRTRGAFAAWVNVHWMSAAGNGLAVNGWSLLPQITVPGVVPEDDAQVDYLIPIRRFANGIGPVLNSLAFSEPPEAVLHANSKLEATIGKFVSALNKWAKTPLHDPDYQTEAKTEPDPDEPGAFLQTQPGFDFKHTQHMGDMVFVRGPGEDTSDWPQQIGNIVRGPEPDPPYQRQRWYVVHVTGIPQHRLDEFGFGIHKHPKLQTFDTAEAAALAIWLVRSRMPETTGVLGKKRYLPNMPEAKIPKVDDPEAFVRNYAHGRFFVAGKAGGKTYFWHYGIPSWTWYEHGKPDSQSAKEYTDALAIARNLRGKSVKYPHNLEGPPVDEVFIVPEKGGDFIRVNESEDLDAPDIAHWSDRLSIENRLTKIYGRGEQYMRDDPAAATKWDQWFNFGVYSVYSTFTIFYKVKDAPSGTFYYQVKLRDWEHHNSEFVHGQANILKYVEKVEQAMAHLKANPPALVTDITRAFEPVISWAYGKERYGDD